MQPLLLGGGGVALAPYLLAQGPMYEYRWIINPFAFLTQALKLPDASGS
jgi:hypothetical protein